MKTPTTPPNPTTHVKHHVLLATHQEHFIGKFNRMLNIKHTVIHNEQSLRFAIEREHSADLLILGTRFTHTFDATLNIYYAQKCPLPTLHLVYSLHEATLLKSWGIDVDQIIFLNNPGCLLTQIIEQHLSS